MKFGKKSLNKHDSREILNELVNNSKHINLDVKNELRKIKSMQASILPKKRKRFIKGED